MKRLANGILLQQERHAHASDIRSAAAAECNVRAYVCVCLRFPLSVCHSSALFASLLSGKAKARKAKSEKRNNHCNTQRAWEERERAAAADVIGRRDDDFSSLASRRPSPVSLTVCLCMCVRNLIPSPSSRFLLPLF